MRALAVGCLAILTLAGCYEPPQVCGIACTTTCPGELVCTDRVCQPPDGTTCAPPPIDFASVTVGGRHVCGLDLDGGAYCWGDNNALQLGAGSSAVALARPAAIEGAWTALDAGGEHTCAIRAGVPWCWGQNARGQARAQSGGTVPAPTEVPFGPSVRPAFDQIAAGSRHTCALGEGQLWCWGDAAVIGTGGIATSVATQIGSVDDWTQLAVGTDHSCAVSVSLGVSCWGTNDRGQAQPATAGFATLAPEVIAGLPAGSVLAIEAGRYNSCAVVATTGGVQGQLWCWGDSYLIDGTNSQLRAPTQIGADEEWTTVAIGMSSMCGALRGRTFCWGVASGGHLPSGLHNDNRVYAEALDLGVVDEVDLAMRAYDGFQAGSACYRIGTEIHCASTNAYGQVGIGTFAWVPTPTEVVPPPGRIWAKVWSGARHSCGRTDDGTMQCWGANERGQITAGSPRGEMLPCVPDEPCDFARPASTPDPVVTPDDLVIGLHFTCARTAGAVHCWGDPMDGRLGLSTTGNGVIAVSPGGGQFTQLLGDNQASCGLVDDGRLLCWGRVVDQPRTMPIELIDPELTGVESLTFAEGYACGKRGQVRVCWGNNNSGQFGDGTQNGRPTPTVFPSPPVAVVRARHRTACVITTAGGVACAGQSEVGQAGSANNIEPSMNPVVDSSDLELTACTALAVEFDHACAICGGAPACWGRGEYGQLGRGRDELFNTRRANAVLVPPELTYVDVSVFEAGGCALSSDGRLFCWGDSSRGQVGGGGSAHTTVVRVGSR